MRKISIHLPLAILFLYGLLFGNLVFAESLTSTHITEEIPPASAVKKLAGNLVITSTSPTNNSSTALTTDNIVINFDQDINGISVDSSTIVVSGSNTGLISGTYSGTSSITFTPNNPFKSGEIISVTVTTAVQSDSGDWLATPYVFSFRVASKAAVINSAPLLTTSKITGISGIYSVYPIDLDKDGDMDIIASGKNSPYLYWYENNGSQSYTQHIIPKTLTNANSVHAADFDRDGDIDFVVSFYDSNSIAWYENNGSQSFTEHKILDKNYSKAYSVSAADLNGDGYLDILTSSAGTSGVKVLINQKNGTFSEKTFNDPYTNSVQAIAADLDKDGALDMLVSYPDQSKLVWFKNDGTGSFSSQQVIDTTTASASFTVYAADLNNDGFMDVISASLASNTLDWYENDGSQSFTKHVIHSGGNGALTPRRVTAADLDGDGDLDLLLAAFDDNKVFWYENKGDETFSKHELNYYAHGVIDVIAADFNGDGYLDIASANYHINEITFFQFNQETIDGSLDFDGSNDYVFVSNNSAFNFGGSSFTIEAWIKVNSFTKDWQALITKGEDAWRIHRYVNTNYIAFGTAGSPSNDLVSTISVNDGKWHHIAAVYDGSQKRLYIDGVLDNSYTKSGISFNTADPVWIGNNYGSQSRHWHGNIDEVRIWNTARTAEQIRQNMFQQLSNSETNLLAYYPVINPSILEDYSSNGYNAVEYNGVNTSITSHPFGAFITGNEGWRLMSSPTSNSTYSSLLTSLWTQGFTDSDSPNNGSANVLVYNEADHSFPAIETGSTQIEKGSGFLMYVFDDVDFDGSPDGFPKAIFTDSTQNSGSISPNIDYTSTGQDSSAVDGWNLVGNPYGSTIDWDAASGWTKTGLDNGIYIWSDSANNGAGDYLTWNGTTGTLPNGVIAPMQGFWIKANSASPTLSFSDAIRTGGGVFYKQQAKNTTPQLRFALSGNNMSSQAIVMLDESALLGKDPLDTWKMQSLNAVNLSLYTLLEDGGTLDINAIPSLITDTLAIPLSYKGSNTKGNFELIWEISAFPEGAHLYLRDNQTGEAINLRAQNALKFHSDGVVEKQKPADKWSALNKNGAPKIVTQSAEQPPRFTLLVSNNQLTGIETPTLPKSIQLAQNYPNPFNPTTRISYSLPSQSRVRLSVFDLLGREISVLVQGVQAAGSHHIQFDASKLASGMYFYRLEATGTVLTKKMTLIK